MDAEGADVVIAAESYPRLGEDDGDADVVEPNDPVVAFVAFDKFAPVTFEFVAFAFVAFESVVFDLVPFASVALDEAGAVYRNSAGPSMRIYTFVNPPSDPPDSAKIVANDVPIPSFPNNIYYVPFDDRVRPFRNGLKIRLLLPHLAIAYNHQDGGIVDR